MVAEKCVRPLLRVLSKASGCSSPDAQKKYFYFLEMFLSTIHIAASEFAGMVNDGKPVSGIRMDLLEFIDQKIKKMKQEEDMPLSGSLDGNSQYSLLS